MASQPTPDPRLRRKLQMTYATRIMVTALGAGLPALVVALALLLLSSYSTRLQWTLALLVIGVWLGLSFALRDRLVTSLRTLSNLLGALREEDYSLRARGAREGDAMGEVLWEVNELSSALREQRLGAHEATALLRKVMEEIDVAIYAFDENRRLCLVNREGERLLGQQAEQLLGRDAGDPVCAGLAECLEGEPVRTFEGHFPVPLSGTGGRARWGLRRSTFREGGLPHHLVVLADLSQPLREEERQAWRRLIRVLGHELNNSLAPIKSMAGTLLDLLSRGPKPVDREEDMKHGLEIISGRAGALSRFMEAYARLARLPNPKFRLVDLLGLVERVVGLETRLSVRLEPGPKIALQADADQLEQLLINLIRNAVDAALETHGQVTVGWGKDGRQLEIWIDDTGPGVADSGNLFVPFFTTKPDGTGIGLVLSRQIAERHGGTVTLENRKPGPGCRATLQIPLR